MLAVGRRPDTAWAPKERADLCSVHSYSRHQGMLPRPNLYMSSQDAEVIARDELNDELEQRNRRLADASRALDAYVASRDMAYRAHLRYLNVVNNLNYGQPASSQL